MNGYTTKGYILRAAGAADPMDVDMVEPTNSTSHPNAHNSPHPPHRSVSAAGGISFSASEARSRDANPPSEPREPPMKRPLATSPVATASPPPAAPKKPVVPVAAPDRSRHWECPVCTYLNWITRPGCELCSTDRPADVVVPREAYVDPAMPDNERQRIERERVAEHVSLLVRCSSAPLLSSDSLDLSLTYEAVKTSIRECRCSRKSGSRRDSRKKRSTTSHF